MEQVLSPTSFLPVLQFAPQILPPPFSILLCYPGGWSLWTYQLAPCPCTIWGLGRQEEMEAVAFAPNLRVCRVAVCWSQPSLESYSSCQVALSVIELLSRWGISKPGWARVRKVKWLGAKFQEVLTLRPMPCPSPDVNIFSKGPESKYFIVPVCTVSDTTIQLCLWSVKVVTDKTLGIAVFQ